MGTNMKDSAIRAISFLAILPATNSAGAKILAERLREKVAAARIDGLNVTISLGIAALPETLAKSAAELVAAADGALYRAKDGGRNRSEIAQQPSASDPGTSPA